MKKFNIFEHLLAAILMNLLVISVKGQISTPCTLSMISSVTPCLNFVTGSVANASSNASPSSGCCSSLKSLMSTGMDCACLLLTANVPFQLPINRTLAISLPRACNIGGGVPVQCKGAASPLPAPGPVPLLLGPSLPPTSSSPLSPRSSKAFGLAPAPTPDPEPEGPAGTGSIRPVLTPSASSPSYVSAFSPKLLFFVGIMVWKCY